MSDYILREVGKALERPTREEVLQGLRATGAAPQDQPSQGHPRGTGLALIALDASAVIELVLNTPTGLAVGDRIVDPASGLHVPHLADVLASTATCPSR